MREKAWATIVLVATMALAGCASAPEGTTKKANSTQNPTPTSVAPPATVTPETGGVDGLIVDDELNPVVGAEVGLIQAPFVTRTDSGGKFTFSEVPPGVYSIAAKRIGYEDGSGKVTVVAGEVASVQVVMLPVASTEPYPEILPYAGYIRFGQAILDILTSSFGLPGCEKCEHNFNTTDSVKSLIFEIKFQPTVSNPTGPTRLGYQVWDSGTDKNFASGYWSSGARVQLNKKAAGWPDGKFHMYQIHYCDLGFVCYEQRFDSYVTLYHHAEADATVSALKP